MRKCGLLIGAILVVLLGCASDPAADIGRVRIGMDKSAVLETAGSPKYTFRENNEDNWMYAFYSEHRDWKQKVVFKDGKVVKIGRPFAVEKWLKDAQKSKSMEEYEQRVREHQRKTRGHFQNIDGQKGTPDSP